MTQQQIDRLVREANPVPDVAALEPLEVSFPKLDEQRRLDMPGNDRVEVDKEAGEPRKGLLIGAGVAALILVVGLFAIQPWDSQEPVAQSSTTLSTTPSPTISSTSSPTDTSTWTTFESERYGFTIGHPSDWNVSPSEHDWTMAGDADQWLSTGHEVFRPPTGDVRVSAWLVPLDPDTTMETWADVEAWVELYCQQTDQPSCGGIHDRAVELCLEFRDCHPGLLVPFASDVQAFFPGVDVDGMVVVAVWLPDSAPSVAQYGGSQRLLEAFLSTMWVCPRPGITLENCPRPETPPSG